MTTGHVPIADVEDMTCCSRKITGQVKRCVGCKPEAPLCARQESGAQGLQQSARQEHKVSGTAASQSQETHARIHEKVATESETKSRTSKAPRQVYDVVVIGAGVIGCAIARELSRYSIRVVVLEKADDVSQGASKSNSGIVHGGYDEKHGSVKAKYSRRGNRMFQQLDNELHFGYREVGSLVLAFAKDEVPILEYLKANGELNGVHDLSILGRDEILKMEPHVNPDVVAGLYCPSAGVTSPYEFTIALAENAAANDVEFCFGQEVVDILRENNGRFLVRTESDSEYESSVVVNAAGLMSDRIAAMVGANNFHITPRKGEYVLLDKSEGHKAQCVLFPVPSPRVGKGILVSPTLHGNLLLGPTSRPLNEASEDRREVLRQILLTARRTVPNYDARKALTSYSGLRAKCSRGDFVVEESVRVRGFVNVAGIDSPGLTSSPAIAVDVSAIVVGALSRSRSVQKKKNVQIERRPIIVRGEKSNVVCLCEQVGRGEIADAATRIPLCPLDTQAIRRRTRAGAGRCQGARCEGEVAAIVAAARGVPIEAVRRRGRGAGSGVLRGRWVNEEEREELEKLSLKSKL